MAEHFCPMCGERHGEEPEPVVEMAPEPEESSDEVAVAAIEAVEAVAVAAIDAMADTQIAEEETERVEALADMVEAVAEEESEPEPVAEEEAPEEAPPEEVEPVTADLPHQDDDEGAVGPEHHEHRADRRPAFRRHRG